LILKKEDILTKIRFWPGSLRMVGVYLMCSFEKL